MSTLSMSLTSLSVSPNLQFHSDRKFFTKCIKFSDITTSFAAVKCSSVIDDSSERGGGRGGGGGGGGGSLNLKDVMSGMVDERVVQLLNNEENRVLLNGLEKATERVELAKKQLSLIQQQEAEAKLVRDHINQLQSKASEIADCQKELTEAKSMVEEAERSLTMSGGIHNQDSVTKLKGEGVINRDAEKLESVKAASISAIVGTLAALPLALTKMNNYSDLILPLMITSFSCALFGVTFRYAIRRDLDNFHLKSGTCVAFGFVKGLGAVSAGPPLELEMGSLVQHASTGAFYVSENLLTFFFAAVALDLCIKLKFLSPFPSD